MICSRCGTTPEDPAAEAPPGWSFETGRRGIQWLCLACTRDNVRSIEAKLPEEWW
jgi:hypothetical protein